MCGGRERLAAARLAAALLLCGCASPAAGPEPALSFPGPGRLAVVWHVGEPDDPLDRHLVVYDEGGAHRLAVEQPREVRWLGVDELLVLQELPAVPGEFAVGRLLRVPLGGAPPAPLLEPRRYYNAEPAPGGSSFAVGVETSDQGESELETWSLRGAEPVRLGRLPHNLDEPRFSPDGDMLVVARMVAPDAEEGFGLSIGGVALPWPRLFAIGSDLAGALTSIHDAGRDAPPVAGGSLPLWWDAAGVYARQRSGTPGNFPRNGCQAQNVIRRERDRAAFTGVRQHYGVSRYLKTPSRQRGGWDSPRNQRARASLAGSPQSQSGTVRRFRDRCRS